MVELEKMITPDWGAKNILDLPNPDEITCVLRHYMSSHPIMRIALLTRSNYTFMTHLYQLILYSPRYFHGPFSWKGANICITEKEEMFEIWSKYEHKPPGILDSDTRLYRITSPSTPIIVMATHFVLSNKHITVDMTAES